MSAGFSRNSGRHGPRSPDISQHGVSRLLASKEFPAFRTPRYSGGLVKDRVHRCSRVLQQKSQTALPMRTS